MTTVPTISQLFVVTSCGLSLRRELLQESSFLTGEIVSIRGAGSTTNDPLCLEAFKSLSSDALNSGVFTDCGNSRTAFNRVDSVIAGVGSFVFVIFCGSGVAG